jgi:flagellar hook assembly protein FlgD
VYTPHPDDGVAVAPDIHSVKVDDISQVDNRPATSLVPGTSSPYASGSELNVEVIKIYSITGQLIRTLDIGVKDAGTYIDKDSAAYWDGLNDEGEEVASGVYFYKLHAGDKVSTRKMVVLK